MKIKRTLSILMSIVLLFSLVTPVLAAEIDPSAQITPRIDPERQKTKSYSYVVAEKLSNGQTGSTIITLDVVVTGVYSQVDGTATMTYASVSIGGPQSSSWDQSIDYEGETVTITVDNPNTGIVIVAYYTIHTNGSIRSNVSWIPTTVIVTSV